MMTKTEKDCIERLADRLAELASLEKASFRFNKEEDAKVKDAIRPYMTWFEAVSELLHEMASDDKFTRERARDHIQRYYY